MGHDGPKVMGLSSKCGFATLLDPRGGAVGFGRPRGVHECPQGPSARRLRPPGDGRTWEVDFDDWMFLVDEQVMINRALMSKFGIRLVELLWSFQRLPG